MIVKINNKVKEFSQPTITVAEIINLEKIPESGTAVAINGIICRRDKWSVTMLEDGADITVISAAFGG
jgi:thiamine biosynthesis protein ThiS